jgi:hypothetical protein
VFSGNGVRTPDHMNNLFVKAELKFAANKTLEVAVRYA